MTVAGIQLSLPVLILGLALGSTYGLLGAGLVLIHRMSGVLNFAIGATGAVGAAVVGYLVVRVHVPYWLAFPAGIAAGALAAALTEVAAVRRLRRAPRLMSLVVTLGMAMLLTSIGMLIFSQVAATETFPSPSWMPTFAIGQLIVTPAFSAMLIFSPIVVICSAVFLRYGRVGTALRATAANGRLAQAVGISASRMSLLAWGIAGAFAAFTTILAAPLRGFAGGDPSAPSLLLHALAAASVARLRSLPVALGAGVVIGVVEQEVEWNRPPAGTTSVLLFVLVALALGIQRREGARARSDESWLAVLVAAPPRLPGRVAVRLAWLTRGSAAVALAGVVLLPRVLDSSRTLSLSQVFAYSIIALGVLVVTGMTGHLSLGHMGFAGIGAVVSLHVARATNNYFLAMLAAGMVGAGAAVIVGIPALRMRGLRYAVVTLAFGLAVQDWLLPQSWALGVGVTFPRPLVGTVSFDSDRAYYLWALGALVVCLLVVTRVRRSGLGRTAIALRDNEDSARVFTIPVLLRTVQVFLLGGFLAGLGGAVLAHGGGTIAPDTFDASLSLSVVAASVIGGLGYTVGPLLGALFVIGVPQLVPLDSAVQAGTALGWLLLVMYLPSGLGAMVVRARDAALVRLGVLRATATDPRPGAAPATESHTGHLVEPGRPAAVAHDRRPAVVGPSAEPVLRAVAVGKRYGGVIAVDDVSVDVVQGEILGLIGPNGAGKTTLFEILSGFTRPDRGVVSLLGRDVTRSSPQTRSRSGLVRSFQDCRLFPTMTVHDTVALAHERRLPSRVRDLLVAGSGRDARRHRGASDLIDLMGLGDYADKRIAELSTGTRRVTELACVLALRPRVLLLDEPSAGIAQRESEALVEVLRRVRGQLDATLVVIEHDVPLMLALVDRLIAMETGQIIASGSPREVIQDAEVVRSYLGTDATAIERSAPRQVPMATGAGPK